MSEAFSLGLRYDERRPILALCCLRWTSNSGVKEG